jgi:hypothetical protein
MSLISTAIIHIDSEERGETLEFRNGEILDFYLNFEQAYDLRRSGFLYAIRLVRVPEPPQPSSVNTGFTVICCRQFDNESTWGWVNLPDRTKNALGEHLVQFINSPDFNPIDHWIYLIVRRKKEELRAEHMEFKATIVPLHKPFWLIVERASTDDINYRCRIDLSTCPVKIYEKIVSNAEHVELVLETMGITGVSSVSMLYKSPRVE